MLKRGGVVFKKIFTGPFFYAFFTGLFWWQYASGGGQFAFWFAVLNTAMLAWQLYALWFKPSGGNAQLNDGSPKPNLKEWTVSVGGATIKVSNWWSLKGGELVGAADLYINDVAKDQNTSLVPNPHKPLLSAYGISETVQSVEVFAAGVFKVKVSIMVNGEVALRENLSWIDRLFNKTFPK